MQNQVSNYLSRSKDTLYLSGKVLFTCLFSSGCIGSFPFFKKISEALPDNEKDSSYKNLASAPQREKTSVFIHKHNDPNRKKSAHPPEKRMQKNLEKAITEKSIRFLYLLLEIGDQMKNILIKNSFIKRICLYTTTKQTKNPGYVYRI